jgi:hypothetical protein
MGTVPKLRFLANKYVNLFYHLSTLFAEYFSDEESSGILNNTTYRQANARLKTEKLHQLFQSLQEHSFYAWDFAGKSLSQTDTLSQVETALSDESKKLADIWLKIYSESLPSYESVWTQTEPRLKEYMQKFQTEWSSINESVLSKMADIAKRGWKQDHITVHFVSCVNGASAWINDIVLPPFPNVDVEKKLLAHELAHTLVPDYALKPKLQSLALDSNIAHTAVDLIAYFSIKEHVTDPEKRGIKPNPTYYAQVDKLYPVFEDCYKHPEKYNSLDEILRQIAK